MVTDWRLMWTVRREIFLSIVLCTDYVYDILINSYTQRGAGNCKANKKYIYGICRYDIFKVKNRILKYFIGPASQVLAYQ